MFSTERRDEVAKAILTALIFGTMMASSGQTAAASVYSSPMAPDCGSHASYTSPVDINYTSTLSAGQPVGGLPGMLRYGNDSLQVSSVSPVSVAANATRFVYGLFRAGSGYYLAITGDLARWKTMSNSVVPTGYQVSDGMGLAVTRSGLVLVSATRLLNHQNSTVFVASHDFGATFHTVLNVSLKALPQSYTHLNSGPGYGFWHGVAETSGGYLFAALYNPQGLIYRSLDKGDSWQLVFNASSHSDWHNEIHDVEVDPADGYIYAITDDESGATFNQSMLVSTDNGDHWAPVYSAVSGGAGLPEHLVPTTIGFFDDGKMAAMGLEGSSKTQFARTIFLLGTGSQGCLHAVYRISASKHQVDPFISWWMLPGNRSTELVLTRSIFQANDTLGVGVFALREDGGLSTLMTLSGVNREDVAFLQAVGPLLHGAYGILVFVQNRTYLIFGKLSQLSQGDIPILGWAPRSCRWVPRAQAL